jgi:Tfp pilus assembly protein PilX
MCAARKLLFIAVLISIFTVGAARAELEVNRINSKNGSGASIAQGTFEALENRGKVSIKTKSLESQIVTQLKDRFKARVTDAGAKELAVKIADLIVTQFRKNVGAELWNADNRQAMTVTAIARRYFPDSNFTDGRNAERLTGASARTKAGREFV